MFTAFHRTPKRGNIRTQWIESIETHQKYDSRSLQYPICELHFDPNDLYRNGALYKHKKGKVPSIFPDIDEYVQCALYNCTLYNEEKN